MISLGSEPHSSTIASSSLRQLIVGTASMPCQSHQDRAIGSVIIVVLLFESRRNLVIDLLVVLLLWDE